MRALSVLFLASLLGAQVAGAGPDAAAEQRPTGDSRAGILDNPASQLSTDPAVRVGTGALHLPPSPPALLDVSTESNLSLPDHESSPDSFSRLLDELFEDYALSDTQALDPSDTSLPDLSDLDLSDFELPIVVNASVQRWLVFFAVKERESFEQWLAASTRYLPLLQQELQSAGLPRELAYVAMIESGFDPNAGSPMGARGIWQFMSITAKAEGLRVGSLIDERRDPVKSTRAAVRHLETLYRKYGDWYLSLAAYNAGIGTVARATSRYRSQDFWELVRRGAFRKETAQYVPRLLAASIIASNPERFGFYEVPYQDVLRFASVEVHAPVSLPILAARLGINPELLFELNPELIRGETPAGSWTLRIPPETLAIYEATAQADASRSWMVFRQHRVRPGDTLARLARDYGVKVSDLKSRNGLKRDSLKTGQVLLVPVVEPDLNEQVALAQGDRKDGPLEINSLELDRAEDEPGRALSPGLRTQNGHLKDAPVASGATRTWKVRRGDSLASIARNFGLQPEELRRLNGLSASRVRPGQELQVPLPQGLKVDTARTPHRVQAGDTLSAIARKYTVRLEDLRRVNGLQPGDTLAIGQNLSLPTR